MKAYCLNCNSPTEYSDIKPKFCAYCQHPFESYSEASPPRNKRIKERAEALEFDNEGEEDFEDDQYDRRSSKSNFGVKKIEIEPIDENFGRVESLAEVVMQRPSSSSVSPRRKKVSKKVSMKQFQKEWASELTDRKSKEIGGK